MCGGERGLGAQHAQGEWIQKSFVCLMYMLWG